jgi:hypothetical protein
LGHDRPLLGHNRPLWATTGPFWATAGPFWATTGPFWGATGRGRCKEKTPPCVASEGVAHPRANNGSADPGYPYYRMEPRYLRVITRAPARDPPVYANVLNGPSQNPAFEPPPCKSKFLPLLWPLLGHNRPLLGHNRPLLGHNRPLLATSGAF